MTGKARTKTDLFGVIALLAGVVYLGQAAAATKVEIAVPPIADPLASFVAKDQGFFAKHGLDAKLVTLPNAPATIPYLVSGEGQIGILTPVNVLIAAENGIPVVLLAGAQALPNAGHIGMVVRNDGAIKQPQDLVGRKVGLPAFKSILHLATLEWLTARKVDPGKLTMLEVAFPQQPDMLRSGQVDAIVTADPFYGRAIENNAAHYFGDLYEDMPRGMVTAGYAALSSWAEANPDVVTGFRAGLQDAIDFIKTHDPETRESLARWTKLPLAAVAHTEIPNLQIAIPAGEMKYFLDLSKQFGMIEGRSDPARLAPP